VTQEVLNWIFPFQQRFSLSEHHGIKPVINGSSHAIGRFECAGSQDRINRAKARIGVNRPVVVSAACASG